MLYLPDTRVAANLFHPNSKLRRKISPLLPRCEDTEQAAYTLRCSDAAIDAASPHTAGSRAGYILKCLHCLCTQTQKQTCPATHCFKVSDAFWSGFVPLLNWTEKRGRSALISQLYVCILHTVCNEIVEAIRWKIQIGFKKTQNAHSHSGLAACMYTGTNLVFQCGLPCARQTFFLKINSLILLDWSNSLCQTKCSPLVREWRTVYQ